ncbi:uncharacterized protein GIQ15_06357 [Arthroderma uncinatum]|uniref:uncharacterized protein n=1 Tax=Arthroderma uncinatum TaxID=74035 RepID=UPI00144A78F3|nr:uncharacterized protein GIQ15_06357 [Arthroderma uncinatum]KAF3481010.1 hypothetical protein GIQ15_06357 [Arthroderma uncinatum]
MRAPPRGRDLGHHVIPATGEVSVEDGVRRQLEGIEIGGMATAVVGAANLGQGRAAHIRPAAAAAAPSETVDSVGGAIPEVLLRRRGGVQRLSSRS